MKILKMRNGIALMAVLVIMLITSLFIPVMFNLSTTSIKIAITGTDRQRASYFARTVTEMSVAAFKKFDSIPESQLTESQKELRTQIDNLLKKDGEAGKIKEIKTVEIAMFKTYVEGKRYYRKDIGSNVEKQVQEADYYELKQVLEDAIKDGKTPTFELREENSTRYYQNLNGIKSEITKEKYETIKETQGEATLSVTEDPLEQLCYTPVSGTGSNYDDWLKDTKNYTLLGKGKCVLTYDGGETYYKKYLQTDDNHQAGEVVEITKTQYTTDLATYMAAVKNKNLDTLGWEVACVRDKKVSFTTTATINGITAKRSCVLILPTDTTDEHWFRFKEESGGNQIFVDPAKATSRIPITYDRGAGMTDYNKQVLLVYSTTGNMIISRGEVLKPGVDESTATENDYYTVGNENYPFVLGVEPGINTTPNNDPSLAIIDGVNYESTLDLAQVNNFVAFTSSKSIKVELPVNLLVNPCRADRMGDGDETNASLYKIMMFQAPDVVFDGRVDMMMSFYVRGSEDARRMSSVVLNAPSSTPYHYHHNEYGRTVKAGRVFFADDCYLWIIPYGDRGSSSLDIALIGGFAETVYKKSDFQMVKIANAGDVYYFNAEVTQTKNVVEGVDENGDGKISSDEYKEVDSDGNGVTDTVTDFVGFSLAGYALETKYLKDYNDINKKDWWNVWDNTQTAIFGKYMEGKLKDATYKPDDFHYIGNINDGTSLIEYPETEDYYVVWNN